MAAGRIFYPEAFCCTFRSRLKRARVWQSTLSFPSPIVWECFRHWTLELLTFEREQLISYRDFVPLLSLWALFRLSITYQQVTAEFWLDRIPSTECHYFSVTFQSVADCWHLVRSKAAGFLALKVGSLSLELSCYRLSVSLLPNSRPVSSGAWLAASATVHSCVRLFTLQSIVLAWFASVLPFYHLWALLMLASP